MSEVRDYLRSMLGDLSKADALLEDVGILLDGSEVVGAGEVGNNARYAARTAAKARPYIRRAITEVEAALDNYPLLERLRVPETE